MCAQKKVDISVSILVVGENDAFTRKNRRGHMYTAAIIVKNPRRGI